MISHSQTNFKLTIYIPSANNWLFTFYSQTVLYKRKLKEADTTSSLKQLIKLLYEN